MAEIKRDRYAAVLQEWAAIERRQNGIPGSASARKSMMAKEEIRFLEQAEATLGKPTSVDERLSLRMLKGQRRAAELARFPSGKKAGRLRTFYAVVRLVRTLTRPMRMATMRFDSLEQQRIATVDMETRMSAVRGSFERAGMTSMATRLQQQHEAGIQPTTLERRQPITEGKLLHTRYTIGQDSQGLPQVTSYDVQRKGHNGAVDKKHRFDAQEVGILSDAVMNNAMEGRPFMATNQRGQSHWYMVMDGNTQMLEPRKDLTAALKQLPIKNGSPEKMTQMREQLEKGYAVEATQRGGGKVFIRLNHNLEPVMEPAKNKEQATSQGQEQSKGTSKEILELREEVRRIAAALRKEAPKAEKGVEVTHSLS